MAAVICSATEAASRSAASRVGPVKPRSVRLSAADLYSYRFAPGYGELARFAELADRLAQLLHPGQPDPAAAHLDHEGAHPVVPLRPAQALDDIGQPGPAPGHDRGQRIRDRAFADAFGQV